MELFDIYRLFYYKSNSIESEIAIQMIAVKSIRGFLIIYKDFFFIESTNPRIQ